MKRNALLVFWGGSLEKAFKQHERIDEERKKRERAAGERVV
jgi:hypothetical protein